MEPYFPSAVIIAAVMPVIILLGARRQRIAMWIQAKQRRKREVIMPNELIRSLIGKQCNLSTGPLGETFKGVKVVDVADNWIRVQDGKRERLINSEYVTSIRVAQEK
jgi:hypothetical protein